MGGTTTIECAECCGGGGTTVPCCENEVSGILIGTVTDRTGTCTCYSDTVHLTSDAMFSWFGTLEGAGGAEGACSTGLLIEIYCDPDDQLWYIDIAQCGLYGQAADTANCDPFELTWTDLSCMESDLCEGTFDLTVTE